MSRPISWLWQWSRTTDSEHENPSQPQPQPQSQSQTRTAVLSNELSAVPDPLKPTPPVPATKTTTTTLSSSPSSNEQQLGEHRRFEPQQLSSTPPFIPQNLKLLFGGALFVPLTMLLTRRALRRRYLSMIPPYYTSTVNYRPRANGAVDGLEAFSLASMHVLSFALLTAGAVACALDINSIDDLRARVRRYTRQQVPVHGNLDGQGGEIEMRPRTDEEIESDLQGWIAAVLSKQFQEKIEQELERQRKEKGQAADEEEK